LVFQALAELQDRQEGGVLCTVVRSQGSTPRHAGSKMLVYADGTITGTVGGGELENRVRAAALTALQDGQTRLLEFSMSDPARGDPGICGGQVEVFVEPVLPKPLLVVVGGGHVGRAVVHLAHWLGFRVVVNDDRPEFCRPESAPEADTFIFSPMSDLPIRLKITPWTYLVVTTRGSSVDVEGLPALLESPAAYIGVIGSRRRWAATRKGLEGNGVAPDKLNRVVSPMGLELNAETPEEIAVSILAEIISLRQGGHGRPMSVKEPSETSQPVTGES
jgi:xanthine dehydrogenase accessory factor